MKLSKYSGSSFRLAHSRLRRGFSLLELLIAIAIMAILAGVVTPVASTIIKSKARAATRDELEVLTNAIAEYFRDTGIFPDDLADLSVAAGVRGWSGPYIQAESADPRTGRPASVVDAWSHDYSLTEQSVSSLQITSAGEDGQFGTSADITRTLQVTPIRREKTMKILRAVNQAIGLYNAQYLPNFPLPSSYIPLLGTLVSKGFLPDSAPFAFDGWGDLFTPFPVGRSPVVQVTSTHLPVNLPTTTSPGSPPTHRPNKDDA